LGKEYKRVLIIGSPGSGKSTLSIQLAEKMKLPVVHLDSLYWNAGWIPTPSDQFRAKVEEKLNEDIWIMDGNFQSTLSLRTEYADLVIFLDFPKTLCTYHILKRVWLNRGKTRPDMGADCPERIDVKFVKWVWNFPRDVRPGIWKTLKKEAARKDIYILHNPKEVKRLLEIVPNLEKNQLIPD